MSHRRNWFRRRGAVARRGHVVIETVLVSVLLVSLVSAALDLSWTVAQRTLVERAVNGVASLSATLRTAPNSQETASLCALVERTLGRPDSWSLRVLRIEPDGSGGLDDSVSWLGSDDCGTPFPEPLPAVSTLGLPAGVPAVLIDLRQASAGIVASPLSSADPQARRIMPLLFAD